MGRSLFFLLVALCVLSGQVGAARAEPQRIVSTNLCADQLALSLAPERVVSVSWVAGDGAISNVAALAEGLPRNDAELEEVLASAPELVLTDAFAGEGLALRLQALGVRVHRVGWAGSIGEAVAVIRLAAKAMDVVPRGEALIADMAAKLSVARMIGTMHVRQDVLLLRPAGHTAAGDTLAAELMSLVGLSDMAMGAGMKPGREIALEEIVALSPPVLLLDAPGLAGESRAESLLLHPALQRMAEVPRIHLVPTKYWICPGPWLGDAALTLASARR